MHAFKYLLTLLMGISFAVALALPAPALAEDAAVAARQNKNGNNANCAAAKKLAAGIDENIQIQKQEQSNVAAVKKIVNSNNVNKGQFDQAKKTLLSTVNKGIQVRENNQKIAPKGNAAVNGLGTVAKAQSTELKQAQSLKGTKADLDTIAQLEKEFAGGIEQNQKNKAAALKGC